MSLPCRILSSKAIQSIRKYLIIEMRGMHDGWEPGKGQFPEPSNERCRPASLTKASEARRGSCFLREINQKDLTVVHILTAAQMLPGARSEALAEIPKPICSE